MKDSLVNRRLNGFYIESLLGRGGMARVYRGVDINLQRYVAIKVIDAPYRKDPNHVARFAREARVIAQLGQHPNVVKVYHYGEDQGYLFIAMQYIEGADLGAIIRSYQQDGERMPIDEVLRITWDVCDALDYIHSRGVIHRDLKPSNIMLDPQGRAVLADFGLALITETGTMGEAFGSPHYIPPEQVVSSANAVPQSDLYSLGVILYELFTGRLPFDADNPMNLAMLHMSQPPPSPRNYRPDLSPAIEAVILKALAKSPDDRYPNGHALYADLERAVHAALPQAGPPATLPHLTIPFRVQRASHPLPPPSVPAGIEPGGGAPRRPAPPPPPTMAELPPAYGGAAQGPLVIPVQARRASGGCLTRLALPLALMLAAVLLCVGGIYAMSTLNLFDLGLGGAPTRPTAIAANPTEPVDEPTATTPSTETPAVTETPAPSPTVPGPTYRLRLVKLSDNFLIVANVGEQDFPLQPLLLGRGNNAIPGAAWGVDDLEPGDCVLAMRQSRRVRPPDDPGCFILSVVEGGSSSNFWNRSFDVYYFNEPVGRCRENETFCEVQIPVPMPGE